MQNPSKENECLCMELKLIFISMASHLASLKGRTIRKVTGGGGWGIFESQEFFFVIKFLYEFFLGLIGVHEFFSFNFPLRKYFFLLRPLPP